ncbi:unnamed protein product [Commensalibacter communis]|uniref:Uncharacterized protein n=1 Tax=Commensalibacter communis TaxID=2972786 RepID=A0A9W4XIH5_9PROT|nr:hypothetical protein [Commensalibacter communis]CAI3949325.1 unnamed protein product [Commensalibacter communis]CAI3950559.1 unnamed protein product [Commensalibacter communis]CAI3951370.1 unnamed protein product [Commensalibacter communis]CAI3952167.1 unnamed protein product [Commensalibacter communis]CAI3952175.1 unnamed protein product [Commensalibacter communis]
MSVLSVYGAMILLTIITSSLFMFFLKIIGSVQKDEKNDSLNEAIQRDTDEFNRY